MGSKVDLGKPLSPVYYKLLSCDLSCALIPPTATHESSEGKFALEAEEQDAVMLSTLELKEEIELAISDLLEPVLIT